ncbi:hypothetical protein SAMN04487926_14530 [Paraburkholderia steynii]|uniref:Uncharacterized protein n=1 Tax=Paraburkholderia steynii TaxID=1245441 RepID=A0A7Z7BJ49_9BURK|nr:hypothetical protein SAMN04487926_14530 [Paraburkholderia steynii]
MSPLTRISERSHSFTSLQPVGGSCGNVFKQRIELGKQVPAGTTRPLRDAINNQKLERVLPFSLPQFVSEGNQPLLKRNVVASPCCMRHATMRYAWIDAFLE